MFLLWLLATKVVDDHALSLYQATGSLAIVGLVEAVKRTFPSLSARWWPFLNIFLGLAWTSTEAIIAGAFSASSILTGTLVGLSAGGLYSGVQTMKDNKS